MTKDANPDQKRSCFMISPIGLPGSDRRKHADMVLNSIVRPALPNFEVTRADDLAAPAIITDKMIEAIINADLAVADLSFHNPNVFYELGLRHMVVKPVIHMQAVGTERTFDNANVNTIDFDISDWDSHLKAREKLTEFAATVMAPGYKVSNPVTASRASTKLAQSSDTTEQLIAQMRTQIAELQSQVQVLSVPAIGSSRDRLSQSLIRDSFRNDILGPTAREALITALVDSFRNSPDRGTHSFRWLMEEALRRRDNSPRTPVIDPTDVDEEKKK